jgi:hypothetical protein
MYIQMIVLYVILITHIKYTQHQEIDSYSKDIALVCLKTLIAGYTVDCRVEESSRRCFLRLDKNIENFLES